jgi:hypothetical protein
MNVNYTNRIIFWLLGLLLTTPSLQSQSNNINRIELSLGYNFLIYQSAYGFNNSSGADIFLAKTLNENLKAGVGIRMGVNPLLPEGFLRGIVTQTFGVWNPSIGIETGITNRANFESPTNLLKETREAMLKDIGYCYLSTHVEPLSFDLKNKFGLSFLELDIGTHYKHFGKTLRVQTTIVRIRKYF